MKPSQNLWPLAIILTFVLFISGTVSLVVMACSQKVDLVSSNYYEDELKFQAQLDRLNRARQLGRLASVAYDAQRQCINISLPPEEVGHEFKGRVQLYRPSASGQDRQIDLRVDNRGVQSVDATGLARGLWKVRVAWTVDQQDYLIEQQVVIGAKAS